MDYNETFSSAQDIRAIENRDNILYIASAKKKDQNCNNLFLYTNNSIKSYHWDNTESTKYNFEDKIFSSRNFPNLKQPQIKKNYESKHNFMNISKYKNDFRNKNSLDNGLINSSLEFKYDNKKKKLIQLLKDKNNNIILTPSKDHSFNRIENNHNKIENIVENDNHDQENADLYKYSNFVNQIDLNSQVKQKLKNSQNQNKLSNNYLNKKSGFDKTKYSAFIDNKSNGNKDNDFGSIYPAIKLNNYNKGGLSNSMNLTNRNFNKTNTNFNNNFLIESHKRNASSNNVLKKSDFKVLGRIDKLYLDLKEKEKKIENIVEPFLSRNKIKNKKENSHFEQMKNLKNSVRKQNKEIKNDDPSFLKINVYNSNEIKNFGNINEIFNNKVILNNINVNNIKRNQKVILLPNKKYNAANKRNPNNGKYLNKNQHKLLNFQSKDEEGKNNNISLKASNINNILTNNNLNEKGFNLNTEDLYLEQSKNQILEKNEDENTSIKLPNVKLVELAPIDLNHKRNFSAIPLKTKSSHFENLFNEDEEDIYINKMDFNDTDKSENNNEKQDGHNITNDINFLSKSKTRTIFISVKDKIDYSQKGAKLKNSTNFESKDNPKNHKNSINLPKDSYFEEIDKLQKFKNNYYSIDKEVNTNFNLKDFYSDAKKTSNFSSCINWRSKSKNYNFVFDKLNQNIDKIYDIQIKVNNENMSENKVAIINEELKEEKYFDNLKFNYMIKNFQRFKEYIQKPVVLIKPSRNTPVHQLNLNNETKLGILKKLQNAMLKNEIQKKNLL